MYYTVDTDNERTLGEQPVAVEFVVHSTQGGGEQRFSLCEGGAWLHGLEGDVSMPAQEDPPVNGLFLALRANGEQHDAMLDTLADSAPKGELASGEAARMELHVTTHDGRHVAVPVRTVHRGTNSITFYRQSAHQTF